VSTPARSRAELLAELARQIGWMGAGSVLLSQAVADRLGIHSTDVECLDILNRLAGEEPMTAGRLAEITGLTTGAITGVIDRLERRGFAHREPDPSDRRRVLVIPNSERAMREFGPLYDPLAKAVSALMETYGDRDLAVMVDFATKANQLAQEHTARLRAEAAAARRSRDGDASGR
jgi:DNA-binding MarR family transcriptional regulator